MMARRRLFCFKKKLHERLAEAKPTGMKVEDWALLDRQALGAVRLSLAKNVAYNLINAKMKEGASVADHVNEFNSIISRLMSVDIKFDDEVQALLLLSSLPESWSGTVTAVSDLERIFKKKAKNCQKTVGMEKTKRQIDANTKLKFDNIRDLILGEDIRRKTSGEYSNSLLSAEDKGRGKKQDKGQKHNRSRSKSKKRGQSKYRQDITCWNCNQKGHFRNQCSKPVTSRDKEVNMAARDYDDALVCCVENTIDDRIMDSGASFHATYCKEELERFKLRSGKVRLADDKTLDIAGIGDVVLKTSFGTSWTLKDVRYIPGLKKRLISVGQLDEEGYHVGFGDQQWKVTKGSLVVARGNKRGSLYLVEVPSDGINAAIDGRGNATLWHQRLGHMSEKGMKILASKGRIPDLQKAVVGFCEPCVLGKQKKVSFVKSGNTRKLQRLELVHTDVYGPTSVASIGGSRYYVTFIDDSSRKVWVYFLKNKSEVFNTFKKWKAAVENETNLRVKCLKSDNGGEYSSRDFIEYCAENGIRMLKTVPETPQQNGVAERMNRTLNERAKSMRLHARLPKMFWEDSVTTAAYLINCGHSVKDVARDKLDAKSVKCTFIGNGSDKMGYRFWDSKIHKVVRSRDVTFNEDSLYGAKVATDSSNLTKPNQKDQVVLVDSPENLVNKSIVSEHGLSSEITQSPGGSSDMGEGGEMKSLFKIGGKKMTKSKRAKSERIDIDDEVSVDKAIYRTEVCTEVCAGAIYPNKVVSEPGYDKQWQKTALGAVRLLLAKNVAYNVVNEKTTYSLFKALSNMYEKPSASNKVFLIGQLVNTKMNEGASVADHVNEFNSILSRLMSVDIKLDDEVQALLLLSSLPESWSGTVTAVSDLGLKADRGETYEVDRNQKRGQSRTWLGYSRFGNYNRRATSEFGISVPSLGIGVWSSKLSFGKSWTLKELGTFQAYRRGYSGGSSDKEGYHVHSIALATIDGRANANSVEPEA
ncbi:putative RNA-directed DNA polymerase [Tanacetum coccineum]